MPEGMLVRICGEPLEEFLKQSLQKFFNESHESFLKKYIEGFIKKSQEKFLKEYMEGLQRIFGENLYKINGRFSSGIPKDIFEVVPNLRFSRGIYEEIQERISRGFQQKLMG